MQRCFKGNQEIQANRNKSLQINCTFKQLRCGDILLVGWCAWTQGWSEKFREADWGKWASRLQLARSDHKDSTSAESRWW